ncbi:MAG: hypothetical protein ABWX59_12875 [Microbacteriaceae bacterium]
MRGDTRVRSNEEWREILLVAGTYLSQGVLAYITMAFLVNYSGGVGIDRTSALGPAFAPTFATGLLASTGSSDAVVVYLVIVCVISVISVALVPGGWGRKEAENTRKRELAEETNVA